MTNTQTKFWSNKYLVSWVIDIYSYKLPSYPSINTATMTGGLKKLNLIATLPLCFGQLFPLPPLPILYEKQYSSITQSDQMHKQH